MDFDAAIEKNRNALLRIVGYWLLVTAIFHTDKRLPPRLSRWVSMLLYKIEKATYFLIIANAKRMGFKNVSIELGQLRTFPRHSRLTIKMVRCRLNAVQENLLDLTQSARHFTKRSLCKFLKNLSPVGASTSLMLHDKTQTEPCTVKCAAVVEPFKAHPP